eukprot:4623681-Pleurochrysis_carterae.AAC.3
MIARARERNARRMLRFAAQPHDELMCARTAKRASMELLVRGKVYTGCSSQRDQVLECMSLRGQRTCVVSWRERTPVAVDSLSSLA